MGDNGLVETGLTWETWKFGCTQRDGGSFSCTAQGLMILSISNGPMKRGEFGGNPLQGKVFRPEPNLLSGSVLGGR